MTPRLRAREVRNSILRGYSELSASWRIVAHCVPGVLDTPGQVSDLGC